METPASLKTVDVTELSEYSRQLDQLLNTEIDKALLILQELKKVSITVSLLAESGIGKAVNTLRKKSTDENVQKTAKALVQFWKSLCDNEVANANTNPNVSIPATNTNSTESSLPKKQIVVEAPPTPVSLSRSSSSSSSSGNILGISSGDAHRDACIKALAKALDPKATEDAQLSDFSVLLARQIEEAIFKEYGSEVSVKYKTAVRSKSFNLKSNEEFRRRVCFGEYTPEKVAKMTAEEMATKELNDERKKLTTEALNDAQMPSAKTSKTDQLRCGKCGKRDASYFQLQTRSSDEPMTTFVTCNVCGHNWKFC